MQDSGSAQTQSSSSREDARRTGGQDLRTNSRRSTRSNAPWDNPRSKLSKRIIYFQIDSVKVTPDYQDLIAAHADYLADHPQVQITLQGHTDERGAREYNIALGEQRSQAIAKMMQLQGVLDNQIVVVSYGEEKPASFGHDEQAWSRNRRVEIQYPEYQQ